MTLKHKVAVVTGAASGIGNATARKLAGAGAHVVLADINKETGEKAAADMTAEGMSAKYIPIDVTDAASIEAFRDQALAWQPGVDIIANVAGWGHIEPFVKNTPEFWRKIVDLNLMGPIAVTRALIDGMIERESGKIINIASDAGRVGSLGETVYSAAKGGVIAFTKSLAREMARYNVTVNCVCPGPTDTPLLAAEPEKFLEAFKRATPMRRFAKPEEIADAILFFADDTSSFVTGQVLSVSGGLTMVD
ncbi:MAG: SDR family oxidoreductase [Rhodospirillales bacterium]|nr:SDR family oxidoreductase [Rhodospirillales bacterium]